MLTPMIFHRTMHEAYPATVLTAVVATQGTRTQYRGKRYRPALYRDRHCFESRLRRAQGVGIAIHRREASEKLLQLECTAKSNKLGLLYRTISTTQPSGDE